MAEVRCSPPISNHDILRLASRGYSFNSALRISPGAKKLKAAVEPDKCLGCGVCAVGCSSGAISMRLVRQRETIPG
ncbi:MAG: 4Fe-4S binding protein [Dehalococcoidia bacterium]|nr:4Fe-4S binding protein [Dehalococcoidia bacterium]